MNKVFLLFLASLVAQLSWAADGVLEINQTCALNGGCFPGDSAGFPVEITNPGSYVLTSNLDLTAHPDTIAIEVAADGTGLDLGGFSIIGDITCTGSGASLDCPSGAGRGITASGIGVRIHNGTVRNHSSLGIDISGEGGRVNDVFVRHNGAIGINIGRYGIVHRAVAQQNNSVGILAGTTSVIKDSIAWGNSGDGFDLANGTVIDGSTSFGNGGAGFKLNVNSRFGANNTSSFNQDPDMCGMGECTHLRRYYRTANAVTGDMVRQSCVGSFRPAAAYELQQYNHLHYDRILGEDGSPRVGGPPTASPSWVHSTNEIGNQDCNNWTSADMGDIGSAMRLENVQDWDNPGKAGSPWFLFQTPCNVENHVWCIEERQEHGTE